MSQKREIFPVKTKKKKAFGKPKRFLTAFLALAAVLTAFLSGCGSAVFKEEGDNPVSAAAYEEISQQEAWDLMQEEEEVLSLDVRTEEEFGEGHIKGAVCIPNETIDETVAEQLPDKEQLILVYCRSGNRSKQASKKLADLGYTNVKEFGGINTWDYGVEQ